MAKTVDNATPLEGTQVIYSLAVTNISTQDATGVIVTDNLPGGVTYVSSSGSYDNATGQWNVGNVAAGSSATLQITVNVNNGTTGSTINNVAAITAVDQPDTDSSNNNGSATITVMPELSISDVTLQEGDSGTTAFVFNLTLSAASSQAVSIVYDTADGTATVADNDYQPVSGGVVSFPIGSTSQPLTINVVGDTNVEIDETFVVNLSGPVNTLVADSQGVGTIVNDDTVPAICSSPSVTLTAVADAYIRNINNIPTGGDTILQVRPDSSSTIFHGLMQFDLSAVSTISCAELWIYEETTTSGQTVYVHPLTENWTEGDVTWVDRTAADVWSTPGGVYGGDVANFTSDTSGVRVIDLTTLAQSWVGSPASNFGILLRSTTTGDNGAVTFSSRESGNPAPRLVIEY